MPRYDLHILGEHVIIFLGYRDVLEKWAFPTFLAVRGSEVLDQDVYW